MAASATHSRLMDFVNLTKPNITTMVLLTTGGGIWLAPGDISWSQIMVALLGTTLVVGAANTLNCYIERESDKYMARTKNRPLPAGRMNPQAALFFGLALALTSVPALMWLVNPVTGLLAAGALVSYVWIYTPMKRVSPKALLVGAIPGAAPPLMGWTAVTGRIEWPGVVLFGILFLWQLPHFIAISVYRENEYTKAGLKTVPAERGARAAQWHQLLWCLALLPVSVMLVPLDIAGPTYLVLASVLGLIFIGYAVAGVRSKTPKKASRKLFIYSLIYLTVLFAALVIDAIPMFNVF